MMKITDFFLGFENDTQTQVLIAVDIILLVLLFFCIRWRKKQDFLYEAAAQDQRRMQLDHRLMNPEYLARFPQRDVKRYPHTVIYTGTEAFARAFSGMYLDLTVQSGTTCEKYYTSMKTEIDIGRDGSCAVTVLDDLIALRQCLLFERAGGLYVYNLAEKHTVIVERDTDFIKVEGTALLLESGDCIRMGTSLITIQIRK